MAKHPKSKAHNQTVHFKRRCEERLGVQINRKDIQRKIKEQKFNENFYFLDRQSNRVTRFRYRFNDIWYIIPYDKNTHKVITIFKDNKQDIEEKTVTSKNQPKKTVIFYIYSCYKYLVNAARSLFSK